VKRSRYTYISALADGTELFFNFFTLALLVFKAGEAERARRILEDPGPGPGHGDDGRLERLLVKNGFLVPADFDELQHLEKSYRAAQITEGPLSLTILPTLACNFRCTYCFERPAGRSEMGREVEEALEAFVEKRLGRGGRLSVTWFGGEPLLRRETIDRLSRVFMEFCAARQASYGSHIVTNGYLLDGVTAAWLAGLKVTGAQVTLDGPPEVHDRRKPLAGGGKTFRRIVDNLKQAADKMEITVRMNVDAENRNSIGRLLDIMIEEGLGDKVGFYPGQTSDYTSTCADIAGHCLGGEEFSLAVLETSLELTRRGLRDASGPAARNIPCGAASRSSFTVTPSGGIAACWNEVAEPAAYIGHLAAPPDAEMERKSREWMGFDPFALLCRDCHVLPICMGGCPYAYLKNGRTACIGWKLHPAEHLLNYYRLKTIERRAHVAAKFRKVVDGLRKIAEKKD
jgi:uncharacterized protein